MIAIVDYGMGNLRSVQKKIIKLEKQVEITSDPDVIKNADKIILPGVGHFANGVKNLKQFGLWDILNEKVINHNTPILGICLGMQLMCKHSAEGDIDGLGWFDADVIKFSVSDKILFKVPHMGWNHATMTRPSPLFEGISKDELFYFVHSYHVSCNNESDILATTNYSYDFTSAIHKDNIYGTQFHPEKSHEWGEKLLSNFLAL